MNKLENTTLICVDCVNTERAISAINKCTSRMEFAAVKLLTSLETDYPDTVKIKSLDSLVMYSIFCLKEMYKYVDTEYFLIVQHDGWIINPESWNSEWLKYDYIAPLFNQYNPPLMGAGGFSFRSTKLMKEVSSLVGDWDETSEGAEKIQSIIGVYEDGFIAITLRSILESQGFKFATLEDASFFCSGGNYDLKYYVEKPFANHQASYFYKCRELITDDGIIPKTEYK